MSFIVKGAEMPKTCWDCPLSDVEQGWCVSDMVTIIDFNKLPVECPLVALPDKHGRLVDADALIKFIEDRYEITWESDCYEGGIKDACNDILEKIDTMPTIVEAEG